jgi:hypothetical protein
MVETELNGLNYLSGVFKELSDEKKDYVLDTARSLFEIQNADIHPPKDKTVSNCKNEAPALIKT